MSFRPDFIALRAQRRLDELQRWLYPLKKQITNWQVSAQWPDHIPQMAAAAPLLEAADTNFVLNEASDVNLPFGITQTYWASAEVTVPDAWAGRPFIVRVLTNTEAMVYVDGVTWQGMDQGRPDVYLSEQAEAGRTYRIDVMLFTCRDQDHKRLSGEIAVVDRAVEAYRHRVRAWLGVAKNVDENDPLALHLWRGLEASLNAIVFHPDYTRVEVTAAAQVLDEQQQFLHEQGYTPQDVDIYLVGNSHIDVAWLWTWAETRQKMGRTTATALRYMDTYPQYHFAQSQAQLYDWLRVDFPDLFAAVQDKAAAGRWECIGAAWVEPDCNITGGEALVRQILYGQKFWAEHFGQVSKTMWLPDTFGYASALPQILRKSALDTFVTQKLTWSETNPFPHGHFYWEGIDGSQVRCIFPQVYVARTFPEDITAFYNRYPSKAVAPAFLYPYGYGDGGGGPVREDLEVGQHLADFPGFPRCQFSPIEPALDVIKAKGNAVRDHYDQPLPVWAGELYLEFHRGTLTTHAQMKRGNRQSEFQLRGAELWAALASVQEGFVYPFDDIEVAWKKVLLNQFHDILPGTSIPPVFPEAEQLYTEVEALAEQTIAAALEALVAPDDNAVTVFNALPWAITDYVEITVPQVAPVHVVDESGAAVPCQVVASDAAGTTLGFEATVPALGTALFFIQSGEVAHDAVFTTGDQLLESERFRLQWNDEGHLTSIYDKAVGREWLAEPGNVLQTFEDRPNNWEAWDVNDWYAQKPLDLLVLQSAALVENGPVKAAMRLTFQTPNASTLVQDVVLYRTIPRVDFRTRLDWHEQRVLLKVAFPVAVHSAHATYEIQYGSLTRPTAYNTSWDAAKFEVCGHKWTDLSEGNGGVSLLNDGKYGHDIHGHTMRISLLRTPTHPDQRCPHPPFRFLDDPNVFTDQGPHETNYAFFPHTGDWRNGTVQQGYQFNQPLRAVLGRRKTDGAFSCSTPAVIVEALKRAEDGRGLILRVYEAHGGRHDVALQMPFPVSQVEPVNLMEHPAPEEGPLSFEDQTLTFFIKPYEIKTFRLMV